MSDPQNPDLGDLQVQAVSLILGPKGIELDRSGRIQFVNPEILQAIIAARPRGLPSADDTNYVNCGANNYQCGKSLPITQGRPPDVG